MQIIKLKDNAVHLNDELEEGRAKVLFCGNAFIFYAMLLV
jgi:hypothetical protein